MKNVNFIPTQRKGRSPRLQKKSLSNASISASTEAFRLAPYAIHSSRTHGRKYAEAEHLLRSPFQRDRDRILHSTAFRRLQYKTQVFVNHEGDHYRTRLTHTLETSQIARTLARTLHLNEDLVEAISLAHDIGHGPFGHAGERALRELMHNHGGFEHNAQALRILERLEDRYPDFPGLNLCFETLEGLKKHPAKLPGPLQRPFKMLETETVDLADEIAYISHDIDDGLRSGILTLDALNDLSLWRECRFEVNETHPQLLPTALERATIRRLIDRLVVDVVYHTRELIERRCVRTVADIQDLRSPLVRLSQTMRRGHAELKRFLLRHLYEHPQVLHKTREGQHYLQALFKVLCARPAKLIPDVFKRSGDEGIERAVCDYIAGMTDRFAIQEYDRLIKKRSASSHKFGITARSRE